MFYDESFLFKTAISIFGYIEEKILTEAFEDSLFLIRDCASHMHEDQLFKRVFSSKLTKEKFIIKLEKEVEELRKKNKI